MPASAFVFTSGAKGEVLLNDTSFHVEHFGLFHGGKSTELSIRPADGWMEYYMLFYKAGEPPFHKREKLVCLQSELCFSKMKSIALFLFHRINYYSKRRI